jgi:hypothetical protein
MKNERGRERERERESLLANKINKCIAQCCRNFIY